MSEAPVQSKAASVRMLRDLAASIDPARMRRQRFLKTVEAMERHDVDVLLTLTAPNVNYVCGARIPLSESGREQYVPVVSVVVRDKDRPPHLFTPTPQGAPPDLPAEHVHPPLVPEFAQGVRQMVDSLRRLVGPALDGKVAVDDLTAAMYTMLPELLPEATILNGVRVLQDARMVKTEDEVRCIRMAQVINEGAAYDVLEALRPGVRESDLTATYLRSIYELGATGNALDAIWQVTPQMLRDGPHTLNGELAFVTVPNDRIIRDGELIMMDTCVEYLGYGSDLGRTWLCAMRPHLSSQQRDQYQRWREVFERMREEVRPGRTALDLRRAALHIGGPKPWLSHHYIGHNIGLALAEPPFIGTDLGLDYEESMELKPGMVFVLEPCIWEDGVGVYRAEELLVVTENGNEQISDFPHGPWAGE